VGRLLRWVDRFWWATGQIAEARYWGEHVLAYDGQVPPVTRARALFIVGSTAMLQGDDRAEKVLGEGRALGQAANDPWAEGFCLLCLGALAPLRGDVAGGTDLLWQAQARLREAADDWAVGMTWGGLSALALAVGQFDEAERFAQEHLALARAAGDLLGMTQGWDELALVSLVRQDQDQAAARLREEIVLALEVGQPEHIASGLDGLALVAANTQPARAARQFGAAEALRQAHGLAVLPTRRPLYEPALQALRAALGTSAFAAAWAEGQAMPREQAVAYALEQATAVGN
jgi:tetratricopeptide (TPR) repeat protein